MLYWYRELMLDDKFRKNPEKYKKKAEKHYRANPDGKLFSRKLPVAKQLFVVVRATNPDNLFEVMGTRQWIFSHYGKTDLYVIGLYPTELDAVEALEEMLADGYIDDPDYDPRSKYADDGEYSIFTEDK